MGFPPLVKTQVTRSSAWCRSVDDGSHPRRSKFGRFTVVWLQLLSHIRSDQILEILGRSPLLPKARGVRSSKRDHFLFWNVASLKPYIKRHTLIPCNQVIEHVSFWSKRNPAVSPKESIQTLSDSEFLSASLDREFRCEVKQPRSGFDTQTQAAFHTPGYYPLLCSNLERSLHSEID